MFLARKITRAKWVHKKGQLAEGEIAADAVTADLRTQDNSLSFWRCPTGTKDELEKVALAIAATRDRVEKIEIVWLAENELLDTGQYLKDTEGQTPVLELTQLHVDVCRLDYVRLGKVAHHIINAIENKRYCRLSRRCVTDLLAAAVLQEQVQLAHLQEGVATEVQNLIKAGT